MPLNGYVLITMGIGLLLSPILLPLSPFMFLWWRRQVRLGREAGLRVLPMRLAETLQAGAEASFPDVPKDGWFQVPRNVDRFLADSHSPRGWRVLVMLTAAEFMPWLTLRKSFSRMSVENRREFLRQHLSTNRGPRAVPSLMRQLLKLGYYTESDRMLATGFRRMGSRKDLIKENAG